MSRSAWLGVALCLLAANLWDRECRAQSPSSPLAEPIVVTGERDGPGLWHVRGANSQLWILGSLSPLPRGLTWRSKQVERVLDGTSQVLVPTPLEIGVVRALWLLITDRKHLLVPGGRRLADVMPVPLYARFALQRQKYTGDPHKWQRFRPIIAAAFLEQAAFDKLGLSMRIDLGAALRILAKKHHVRVEEISLGQVGDVVDTLNSMTPAAENICVEAFLATVESGLPRLLERAQAWASGDVERFERMAQPAEINACRAALDAEANSADLLARASRSWFVALDHSLQIATTTVAVVDMDMLLERGGLLDQLRARGYQIDAQ
jgi:uncharacterized protein YbaP (TraB family)